MSEASSESLAIPVPPKSINSVIDRIGEVSTLPQVAFRVMEVARDPNAGAADLKAVLEGDPALSSRVLRTINSAAYSLRSTITNLQQAIGYLGFSQIRNLAMTASVAKVFREDKVVGSYGRRQLWRHLVSVGICARLVALRLKHMDFEDCFLAGLLHDLGIVLEDQHLHEPFCYLMQTMAEGVAFTEAERAYLGFDHAMLGARMAEKWSFPATIQGAIRCHHRSGDYRGDRVHVVRCVEVANVVCSLKGITSIGRKLANLTPDTFTVVGLQKEDIVVLAKDLDGELSRNQCLFEL
jgi:putative nucleotidyltransferase with HDIG domain